MSRFSDSFYSSGGPADVYGQNRFSGDGSRVSRSISGASGASVSSGVSHMPLTGQYNYDDRDYLAAIAQYKDEPFYQYLLTNPWMFSKQGKYSDTAMDELASAFGFNTGEEAYYNGIRSNQMQWLSDAVERFRQEQKNSAVSQASDLAAAGINPDLQSGSVSPGMAAENDQPIIPGSALASPDYGGSLSSLASLFMSIYSFASGVSKDVAAFGAFQNDLASSDLSNASGLSSLVTDFIGNHVGLPEKDSSGKWSFPDISDSELNEYARNTFSSRHARRAFVSEFKSTYSRARGYISRFGSFKSAEDARAAFVNSLGRNLAYGRDSYDSAAFDPMVILTETLSNIQKDLDNLKLEYDKDFQTYLKDHKLPFETASADTGKKQAEFDSRVLDKRDSAAAAAAANSADTAGTMHNWASYYKDKEDKIIHKNLSDAAEKLHSAASKNGESGAARATEFGLRLLSAESSRKSLLNEVIERIKYKGRKRGYRDSSGRWVTARDKRF